MSPRAAPLTRDDCLTDDEITSLVRGEAPSSEREQWMMHLDECRLCRTVLSESAQHLAGAAPNAGYVGARRRLALILVLAFILGAMALVLLRAGSS